MEKKEIERGKVINLKDHEDMSHLCPTDDIDMEIKDYAIRKKIAFPEYVIEKQFSELVNRINKDERKIKASVISAGILIILTIAPLMLINDNPKAGDNNILNKIVAFRDRLLVKNQDSEVVNNDLNPPPQTDETICNKYSSFTELYKNEEVSIYEPLYIPSGYEFLYVEYGNNKGNIEIQCCYNNSDKRVLTFIQNIDFNNDNSSFLIKEEEFKILNIDNNDIYVNINENNILSGMLYMDNYFIRIIGQISETELMKIIEGLKLNPS